MATESAGIEQTRAAILHRVEAGIAEGPFSADWDSLTTRYRVPDWYVDGKFGIFIHWGAYSVPGYSNEWYPREMYRPGTAVYEHHRRTYGPQREFGYKDFIPQLTGVGVRPGRVGQPLPPGRCSVRRAGGGAPRRISHVRNGSSRWNAARMGPERDVVKELSDAVRAQSMIPGASSHRAEHWWFFNGGMKFDSDVRDPDFADFYGPAQREEIRPSEAFLEDWLARTVELVEHI